MARIHADEKSILYFVLSTTLNKIYNLLKDFI